MEYFVNCITAPLYNEMMFEGSLDLNVQDRVPGQLATGKYIYRFDVQDRKLAKSIMVA